MNQIENIQNWYLTHNSFLKNNTHQKDILDILTFYTIAFEKVSKINNDNQIILNGQSYQFVSGNYQSLEPLEFILKVINQEYGYLDFDLLSNSYPYKSFLNYYHYDENIPHDILIVEWFNKTYHHLMERYEKYNFNKHVYKVGRHVFFSLQKLTEEESKTLQMFSDDSQHLWEIFHEDGKMYVY